MRIDVKVNGKKKYSAGVKGPGYLHAVLAANNVEKNRVRGVLRVTGDGIEDGLAKEIYVWKEVKLRIGDEVFLTVREKGKFDKPKETETLDNFSFAVPRKRSVAEALYKKIDKLQNEIDELKEESRSLKKKTDREKFGEAIDIVLRDIDDLLKEPIRSVFPDIE